MVVVFAHPSRVHLVAAFVSTLDMSISSWQLLTSFTRLAKGISGLVPGPGGG